MDKQPFYPEIMRRKPARPPRFLCRTFADWIFGIQSPSLVFKYRLNCTKEEQKQISDYDYLMSKYFCYERKLRREEWKWFYRVYRTQKNEEEHK